MLNHVSSLIIKDRKAAKFDRLSKNQIEIVINSVSFIIETKNRIVVCPTIIRYIKSVVRGRHSSSIVRHIIDIIEN